ncbi:hypothetical protein MUY27_07475 [Mucilaginibacter sp. RS28]|uniref:Uncharacterized protein n=1 Tax=Mucilaginibacter straminoryzae TaxID=2932774 RepID=A0A9X1X1Q3_9SPHI|nr:hypothetical protein [Mucilaginibacter straminoryzae]MCJ8209544.1 hypothetical protein [Mucilaginibacter straminoryzae]
MSIQQFGLKEIKAEIKHYSDVQLADLCLRMAKYKKENKELLAYLLFLSHDEAAFIDQVKSESSLMFSQLSSHSYQAAKGLRKILRFINKQIKFSASKQVEVELLLHFCRDYLDNVDRKASYKPLRQILTRQLQKVKASISKLHEDLQFDYRQEFDELLGDLGNKLLWFNIKDI